MYADNHCHLHEYEDLMEVLLRAKAANVEYIIGVSMDIPSFHRTKRIANEYDTVVPAIGIHPWNAPKCIQDVNKVRDFLSDKGVMGEIGLDHHFIKNEKEWEAIREILLVFGLLITVFAIIFTLIFFAGILVSLALVLLSQHWVNLVLFIPVVVGTYIDSLRADKRLIKKFGNSYKSYMMRVSGLNPLVGIIYLFKKSQFSRTEPPVEPETRNSFTTTIFSIRSIF